MELRQELEEPISGYWDGGEKKVFYWRIDSHRVGEDSKGEYVRVGSWGANCWFHVAKSKTEKQTLANVRRKLAWSAKRQGWKCKFEYKE